MRYALTSLSVALLAACTAPPVLNGPALRSRVAQMQAYERGSAHAGLAHCAASLDPRALALHRAVARQAALTLEAARPEQLQAAFDDGVRRGGGLGGPHRVPCAEAEWVLQHSLDDYLAQWRSAWRAGP